MHFLHVVQLYHPVASGAARYFAEVGERLVREGHRVTVLATDAYDLEFFWDARKRRIKVPEQTHNGVRRGATSLQYIAPTQPSFPCQSAPNSIYSWYILARLAMDTAKIFQNGKSQAIRLPKEYRFRGTQVYIKRVGNTVVLIPEQDAWQTLVDSLALFSDDFMAERLQPAEQARDDLFE